MLHSLLAHHEAECLQQLAEKLLKINKREKISESHKRTHEKYYKEQNLLYSLKKLNNCHYE